ncbi:MAG: PTS sugar transporter subunit IIA [Bacteroidota bacterium]|jgi:fructose-specific phosphotransferase system IIA component
MMDTKISSILDPSCIRLNLEVKDKADCLRKMVDLVAATGKVKDVERFHAVIVDRERLMSTGIGNGVALPHGKTDVVDESIAAVATLASPIDYDSLDDKPVSIIILLVGPEGSVGLHLRLLSRISRMVGSEQFRSSLLTAKSAADVMALLSGNEEEQG